MWQVVGHDWVVTLLKNSIASDSVSHAYLFTGPPHVGKSTLALNLAQALNCEDHDKPCGECVSCHKIREGVHPDVRTIDRHYQARLLEKSSAQQRALRIDTVRTVQETVSLKPFEGQRKVFIIPEAETMTSEAANCLLKTLEEPPPYAVLLLTASDTRLLLPTIVSRCQVLRLRLVPTKIIEREMKSRYGLDQERASLLARLSEGRMGWAVTAARDSTILEQRQESLKQLLALPKMERIDRLDYAERLSRQPSSIREMLELWLGWWRDLLLIKGGCERMIGNVDLRISLEEQARRHDLTQIYRFMRAIRDTISQLEDNVNPRLALEVLMLDLPCSKDWG
jgi:DNA polymerase-3 subunit delta'